MSKIILAIAAAASLSACASNSPGLMVEQGYQRGALGVAAIDRGDWTAAESQLAELRGVSADDPARLINLGKVYMETGRSELALATWRLALASDRPVMVETADGQLVSTEQIARTALARYSEPVLTAGR